jgi:hypothetical protein
MRDIPQHLRDLAEAFPEGSEMFVTLGVAADDYQVLRAALKWYAGDAQKGHRARVALRDTSHSSRILDWVLEHRN